MLNKSSVISETNHNWEQSVDFTAIIIFILIGYLMIVTTCLCIGPCTIIRSCCRCMIVFSPIWPDPIESFYIHTLFGTVSGGALTTVIMYTPEAAEACLSCWSTSSTQLTIEVESKPPPQKKNK